MNRPVVSPRVEPVAGLLASVVLRGQLDPAGDAWRPGLDGVKQFLRTWGPWFQSQVVDAGRLDLLQGRSLVLAMSGLLGATSAVARIARWARAAGLALEITLDADEALAGCPPAPGDGPDTAAAGLPSLLSSVDGVHLRIAPDAASRQPARLRALVDQLLAAPAALHLAASPAVLRALGVLREPAFCGRYVTVFAEALRPGRPVRVDDASGMSCRAHLRLYIDADGHLYPCAGLFGLPQARLGHLADGDPAAWHQRARGLDVPSWAQGGPSLHHPPPAPYDLCEQHRLQAWPTMRPEAA